MSKIVPIAENDKDIVEVDGVRYSRRDVHEVSQNGNKRGLSPIPERHYNMICNPALYAFGAGIESMHQNPVLETVQQLHTILLVDSAQHNPGIQALMPELLRYLKNEDLYTALCLLFGDAAHLNPPVVKLLLEHGIYSLLDYSRKISFSVVLNMCDCNQEAWSVFRETHMRDKYRDDPNIRILVGRYPCL